MKKENIKKIKNQRPLNELENIIGIEFKDKTLLQKALTHRSYINEHPDYLNGHNERLEFLGDAVLELIVSSYLYHYYPNRPEGELTSFRSAVVKTEALADLARKIQLGEFLRMSKGEQITGGANKDYLLANTLESLIGAMYLDQGFETTRNFVLNLIKPLLHKVVKYRLDIDHKTKFQEIAQKQYKVTPKYKLIKSEGPDHERTFKMGAYLNKKLIATGVGNSKQKAEEMAAKLAIEKLTKGK